MKTQTLIDKGLALDFGLKDGQRTIDRSPEWFLMPEHRAYSFEWYQTGKGSPFRHRRGRCQKMDAVERLDLALELLDIPEVQLWAELGWNAQDINLAALKAGRLRLSDAQLSAIASALGLSPAWLLHAHGPMLNFNV